MVYSLMCARDDYEAYDEIIISYGDIVYNKSVVEALLSADEDFAVVVDRNWLSYWQMRFSDPLSDAESLRLDDAGRIVDIGKEASTVTEIQGQYIGLMKFSRRAMSICNAIYDGLEVDNEGVSPADLPTTRSNRKMYMTDLIQEIIDQGHPVHPVLIDGGWLGIDTLEDYRLAQDLTTHVDSSVVVER